MTLFARRQGLPDAAGYSVIDQQLVVRGEINTQGTIRVDGRLEAREQAVAVCFGERVALLEERELVRRRIDRERRERNAEQPCRHAARLTQPGEEQPGNFEDDAIGDDRRVERAARLPRTEIEIAN